MKFAKGIGILALGFAVSGVAMAQEPAVSAEKQAPIKTLLPNAYGNLSLRHYTSVKMDGSEVANTIPQVRLHPTLGSTFFNDKLDTTFEWVFVKNADSSTIQRTTLVNYTQFKAVEGKYGYFGPYSEVYQTNGASFSDAYLGVSGEVSDTYSLPGTALTLKGYVYTMGVFQGAKQSRTNKIEREDRTGSAEFGLLSADAKKVEKRDPGLENWTGVSATLKPSAVPGLSVGGVIDLLQNWEPKYNAISVDGDIRTEQNGYTPSALTMTRFVVGYKINDTLSVQNQLRHFVGGIYGNGIDIDNSDGYQGTNRWQNRIYLNASLF